MPAVHSRHTRDDDDDDDDFEAELCHRRMRRVHAATAARRRQIMAVLAAADGQGPEGKKRREKVFFCWSDHVERMTAAQFKLRYRLDFEGFNELLGIIRPDLEPLDLAQAKRAKWGHDVQTEAKLAMALRFLAGASPLDLQLIYMVSNSYVYASIWKVVDVVNKHLQVEFPIDDRA